MSQGTQSWWRVNLVRHSIVAVKRALSLNIWSQEKILFETKQASIVEPANTCPDVEIVKVVQEGNTDSEFQVDTIIHTLKSSSSFDQSICGPFKVTSSEPSFSNNNGDICVFDNKLFFKNFGQYTTLKNKIGKAKANLGLKIAKIKCFIFIFIDQFLKYFKNQKLNFYSNVGKMTIKMFENTKNKLF